VANIRQRLGRLSTTLIRISIEVAYPLVLGVGLFHHVFPIIHSGSFPTCSHSSGTFSSTMGLYMFYNIQKWHRICLLPAGRHGLLLTMDSSLPTSKLLGGLFHVDKTFIDFSLLRSETPRLRAPIQMNGENTSLQNHHIGYSAAGVQNLKLPASLKSTTGWVEERDPVQLICRQVQRVRDY